MADSPDEVPADLPMPFPAVIVPDEEVASGVLPDGPTPDTPLGSAMLFWMASGELPEFLPAIRNVSLNPADWGDYSEIAQLLDGYSIASNVEPSRDGRDDVAHIKFIPDMGHSVQLFEEVELDDVLMMTLVHCDDGWWRVWGVSHNWTPGSEDIFK